jgi:hypothetical protein
VTIGLGLAAVLASSSPAAVVAETLLCVLLGLVDLSRHGCRLAPLRIGNDGMARVP